LSQDDLEIAAGKEIRTDVGAERKQAQNEQESAKRADDVQEVKKFRSFGRGGSIHGQFTLRRRRPVQWPPP